MKLGVLFFFLKRLFYFHSYLSFSEKAFFAFILIFYFQNDSSSSNHSATLNKKRKADDFEFETVQRKVGSPKEVKTGTNTNPAVIKSVKKPPKRRHLYVGRLSQNLAASELEEFCVKKNVKLHHIRQHSKSEAHLKAFYCVFKFDKEKIELPDFWPENVTVSRYYLNEAARDWLKKVVQN